MARKRLAVLLTLAIVASAAMAAETPKPRLTTPPPDKMQTNVVKVLRTSSKAQVNQYVCKVYEVKNCNPYEIINFPELLAEAEEGMIYTFVHPDGNKGKILVSCPEYQIPYFDDLIRKLDRPKITSDPGSKYILYRAKNRTAPYLALLASYYGGSQDIFFPDLETNSVLFFGVPSGCDAANAACNAADVPSPQAVIEVTIYDVKLNNDGTFGFDFHAWKNGPGRALFGAGARYQALRIHDSFPRTGVSSHGEGFFLDYPSAYFDFLAEKGKAQVLTSTKLVAMNNRTSQFSTGESVLFYRVTQNNVLDRKVTGSTQPRTMVPGEPVAGPAVPGVPQTAPPQLAIHSVRTGVFLDVTPVISLDLVDMAILASVVTLVGYDDSGQPVLSSRQFSSRSQVRSGQELVIGGLTRNRKVNTTRKVPILGSIPVLGWAFGGEIAQAEKTMVVAVVKPTLENCDSPVRPEDEAVMVQARGEAPIPIPPSQFGFDQWGFDQGK
jgi:type II secretory pathway component GspD/PulD (secretin)